MADSRHELPKEIWQLISNEVNKAAVGDPSIARLCLTNRFFRQHQTLNFEALCNQIAINNIIEIGSYSPSKGPLREDIYFKTFDGKFYNLNGRINQPTKHLPHRIPPKLPPGEEVASDHHGRNNSFWITKSGKVFGRGANMSGSLGVGNQDFCFDETEILSLAEFNITKIFIFGDTTFFLAANGKLLACGSNDYGQLGVGHTANCVTPTLVIGLDDIQIDNIISSLDSYCAKTIFTTSNFVFTCGKNDNGQLSLGHKQPCHVPVKIDTLTGRRIQNVTSLSVTDESYFLDDKGAVYSCWENREKLHDKPKRLELFNDYRIKQIYVQHLPRSIPTLYFLTETGLVLRYEKHSKSLKKLFVNNIDDLIDFYNETKLTLNTLANGACYTQHAGHYHFKTLFYYVMQDLDLLKASLKRFTSAEISFLKIVSICDGFLDHSITEEKVDIEIDDDDIPQVIKLLSIYIALCKEFEPDKIKRLQGLSEHLESIKETTSENVILDDMPRLI